MQVEILIAMFGIITFFYSLFMNRNWDKIKGIHRLLILVYYILILSFSLFFAGLVVEFARLNTLTLFASGLFLSLFVSVFLILALIVLFDRKS
jgi:hypothetical protein